MIVKQLILAGLLLLTGLTAQSAELPKGIMTMAGNPAPELRLQDMDGEAFDLATLRGRWVFVHFWATWCGPCREEMPTIQTLAEQLEPDQVDIVLVNTAETEDEVFSFLSTVAPDLVPLMDNNGEVTAAWQPRGLPATFLVDPEGRIRYLALGGREWHTPPLLNFLRNLPRP